MRRPPPSAIYRERATTCISWRGIRFERISRRRLGTLWAITWITWSITFGRLAERYLAERISCLARWRVINPRLAETLIEKWLITLDVNTGERYRYCVIRSWA